MEETAYAKINLALHVRARRPDGYHDIETIFAFAEDGDLLSVTESEGLALEVTGPFVGGLAGAHDNLVLRAARQLRERYHVREGARLTLDKRLPVASGIGGGSADAAAALRLLARWWQLEASEAALLDIAADLGADVPACLLSRPARGAGRGDTLTPLDTALSGTPILLVNPRVELATAAVFAAWDGADHGPLRDWRKGRNDLEPAAIGQVPAIAEILEAVGGADVARMSGSGATCFGLYGDVKGRDFAAETITEKHPKWWCLATRLR